MTTRDLISTHAIVQTLPPATRTNGTATGTTVDLNGYQSAVIAVSFGAYTDGTHTPSVVHSSDGTNFTTCEYGTHLKGPAPLATLSSGTGSNTVQRIGYIGDKRYIAVVLTTTGATAGAPSAAHIIAGHPVHAPVA